MRKEKKKPKNVNFLKNRYISYLGMAAQTKLIKTLTLLVKEDFIFDISVSDARTHFQYQKTIKKTLNRPKNIIFYMRRMTHRLDIGHPSFCLWSVIFTKNSMQIIHMVG